LFLSPLFLHLLSRLVSTNPEGGNPEPLNHDEPLGGGAGLCSMPHGARAPESGGGRGGDAKPSTMPRRECREEKSTSCEREFPRSLLCREEREETPTLRVSHCKRSFFEALFLV